MPRMIQLTLLVLLGTGGILGLFIWSTTPATPQRRPRTADPLVFDPQRRVPEFPPITDFHIIPASDLAPQDVRDEELVIGVTINGRSRAYLVNALAGPRREILNDKLGEVEIAATW